MRKRTEFCYCYCCYCYCCLGVTFGGGNRGSSLNSQFFFFIFHFQLLYCICIEYVLLFLCVFVCIYSIVGTQFTYSLFVCLFVCLFACLFFVGFFVFLLFFKKKATSSFIDETSSFSMLMCQQVSKQFFSETTYRVFLKFYIKLKGLKGHNILMLAKESKNPFKIGFSDLCQEFHTLVCLFLP